jgi:DNA (cytosine-5)-methyltransferase 1
MTLESSRRFRSLELFSGAGGLALGSHYAGFRHEALVEWNSHACKTLRRNIQENQNGSTSPNHKTIKGHQDLEHWRVVEGDIRALCLSEFGEIDLVAGGPPCQPFSIGGKHNGMKDHRDMIPEFIRVVRELKPRAFIMENVKGLLRQSFQTYFSYTLLRLQYPEIVLRENEGWIEHLGRLEDHHTKGNYKGLHYNVIFRLLNAADYGVPQTRERVFLVGCRSDTGMEYHFNEPTHSLDALLHDQWGTGDYWQNRDLPRVKEPPPRFAARVRRLKKEKAPHLKPWQTVRDAIDDLPDPRHWPSEASSHIYQPGARVYKGHTGSPLDLPAKTLKSGVHGVPGGENMIAFENGTVRYFTVREAARLQTFPDSWHFEGAWSEIMRQLGNAVPVSLARMVSTGVIKKLREHDERVSGIQPSRL